MKPTLSKISDTANASIVTNVKSDPERGCSYSGSHSTLTERKKSTCLACEERQGNFLSTQGQGETLAAGPMVNGSSERF